MKVTMKEIAQRCGVSKSLVSRIISEDSTLRVTPETRQRVLAAVEEAVYTRNINAQLLSSSRSSSRAGAPRIGYVTFTSRTHPGHPYFSHIADGIIEEATRSHVQVVFRMTTPELRQQIRTVLNDYRDHPLDGLILLGAVDDFLHRQIRQFAANVVSMDGRFDKNSDYVGTDKSQSILLTVDHLLGLGYTDFGLLYGARDERFDACIRRLGEEGLSIPPQWLVHGEYTVDIAYERMSAVLKTHRPPRAIVACNDEMAIGCIRALKAAGWRVPEDTAVVGHDDISLAAYVDVPLTTVHIYKREMGRLAVRILMDRIENGRRNAVSLEIPGKLVKRESCGWKSAGKKREGERNP